MNRILPFIFCLSFNGMITAQDFNRARMDSLLDILAKNDRFMGSVSVTRAGEVIYARAVGYADVGTKIAADARTKYRIGSISKTFTTVLAFKAVEEGKLRLDETLDRYYPTIPNATRITLEQMLGHRSGIHSVTDDSLYLSWNTQPQTEASLLAKILAAKPPFEPGTKSEYSNSNFILITFILQRAYGKPYTQLLQDKIVQPLGLKDTYVGGRIDLKKHEAQSYDYDGGWKQSTETDMSVPLGAGAVVSTPTDINLFSTALFEGRLIKPEHVERMKKMQDGFGLGLFAIPYYGKMSYGHTGGIDGFRSVFSYFPDSRVSYAMTSNALRYEMNNISIGMLNSVFNKPFTLPDFRSVAVPVAELDKLKGDYTSKDLPIDITIRHDGKSLIAHPAGQSPLTLDAKSPTNYSEPSAGVDFEFKPAEGKMLVSQGGQTFTYTRKQ
jgi:CubicO group peptidase (beta-lactamase class C family)